MYGELTDIGTSLRSATVSEVLGVRAEKSLANLTLQRPDALNALNMELEVALGDGLADARYDDSVCAVTPEVTRQRQDQLLRTTVVLGMTKTLVDRS